jgi:hypothetical protein
MYPRVAAAPRCRLRIVAAQAHQKSPVYSAAVRRSGGGSRLHNRQALLHVVDIKSRDAIAVLGRVVEQLPKCNTGHGLFSVTEYDWVS